MGKISRVIRMLVLTVLMVTLAFLGVVRLLQIQVVDAGDFAGQSQNIPVANQTIQAVRGQIVDREGRPLNTNEVVHKIIVQRAFLPEGRENEIIAGTLEVLRRHDHEWLDSVPITLEQPFQFKNVPQEEMDSFFDRMGLNYTATIENSIRALVERYNIDTDVYDEQMVRYIAGVRHEMEVRDFSLQNRFVLAEDISMDVLIALKERALILQGVDIVEEPTRVYLEGTVLPHIRGRINAISEEQFEALRDYGYTLNDLIGFFGIEESMESSLRGENGVLEITRDASWEIISAETIEEAHAGNTVKLTIDTEFQGMLQEILANKINWINQRRNNPRPYPRWTPTTAGAIAVICVPTGAILGMATYPTYDLNDHVDLMLAEASGNPPYPHHPLRERNSNETYRPGSAYKTITSVAGLMHGIVDRHSTVFCGGQYRFFPDFQPFCHLRSGHGSLNVVRALDVSCNIYYYDVGRRLGVDRFVDVSVNVFGVGTNLDIDIRSSPGVMATREDFQRLIGRPMTDGDLIQAAIGQSEIMMTPLHMAVAAATIANNGVRLRPHLVHSVWNYDVSELVHEIQPEIVADWREGNAEAFAATQAGMLALAVRHNRELNAFRFLPDLPAYKTGTPEVISNAHYNSTVMGYYPYENPAIAFAVVLDGGEFSSRAIRNIIDAYFYGHYEPVINDGLVRRWWEPWTAPRTPLPGRYLNS